MNTATDAAIAPLWGPRLAENGAVAITKARGMNDFIAKPVDPNVLFATLLKWLRAEHADPGGKRK